jgi:hypothetical protein
MVLPDQPMALEWSSVSESGTVRICDILVNGQKLFTQTLDGFHVSGQMGRGLGLPEELTRGQDHITVKFQALPGDPGASTGWICDVRTSKTESKATP